jgi:hypothetical protein
MKHSDCLKEARKRIVDYRDIYICLALSNIRNTGNCSNVSDIIQRINMLLDYLSCLEVWLLENHCVARSVFDTEKGKQKLRQTRLLWIDDMIQYYERRGQ